MDDLKERGVTVRLIKLLKQHANALDMYIASTTGMYADKGERIAIVSKDKGYGAVRDFWHSLIGTEIILGETIRECFLHSLNTTDERIQRVRRRNQKMTLVDAFSTVNDIPNPPTHVKRLPEHELLPKRSALELLPTTKTSSADANVEARPYVNPYQEPAKETTNKDSAPVISNPSDNDDIIKAVAAADLKKQRRRRGGNNTKRTLVTSQTAPVVDNGPANEVKPVDITSTVTKPGDAPASVNDAAKTTPASTATPVPTAKPVATATQVATASTSTPAPTVKKGDCLEYVYDPVSGKMVLVSDVKKEASDATEQQNETPVKKSNRRPTRSRKKPVVKAEKEDATAAVENKTEDLKAEVQKEAKATDKKKPTRSRKPKAPAKKSTKDTEADVKQTDAATAKKPTQKLAQKPAQKPAHKAATDIVEKTGRKAEGRDISTEEVKASITYDAQDVMEKYGHDAEGLKQYYNKLTKAYGREDGRQIYTETKKMFSQVLKERNKA